MDQLLQGPACADVVEQGGAGILRYLKVFTLEVTVPGVESGAIDGLTPEHCYGAVLYDVPLLLGHPLACLSPYGVGLEVWRSAAGR
jgi:hypothetical protein